MSFIHSLFHSFRLGNKAAFADCETKSVSFSRLIEKIKDSTYSDQQILSDVVNVISKDVPMAQIQTILNSIDSHRSNLLPELEQLLSQR